MEVKDALTMLDEYQTYWSEIYKEAKENLEFSIGIQQWSDADKRIRGNRPCITVNVLPQFIHQVTNQIRQNTPSINVLPAGNGATMEAAKINKGLIRNIEYRSGADEVYDTSAEYSVTCALGFIRVDHDYIASDSFDQELLIKRVQNPLNSWIDPSSVECDGSDAEGAICLENITKAQFEKKYPGKSFVSFEGSPRLDEKRESINIAEIFIKKYESITKAQGDDGQVVDYDETKYGKGKKKPKTRVLKKTVICRYKFSGMDMLEETTFPGEYIPIVPVYGQEIWVDGKRHLLSLISQAKDPQRRYNHWASVEAEILSKAPKAPIMAEVGTIEDFAEVWQNPDSANVLRYKNTNSDGTPAAPPQRLAPPPVPVGIINAMQGAYEDIKRSMGLYDSSVGQKSNETSGVAIDARKQQGDVATFHFADNLSRSIAHVGRILVSAIPEIYDAARIIQIIGDEDEPQQVSVNGAPMQEGQEMPYDLTTGKYDVRVTTGPSFTTKRQESAALLSEALKANPALMGVFGDLYFKSLDVAGAEAIAARVRKTIPPELVADEDAKNGGQEAPTPKEMQMEQALQQMQGEMQQMGQALQEAQAAAQDKQGEQQAAMQKNQLDAQKFQLDQQKLQLDAEKLQLENKKLDIEAFKAKSDVVIAMHSASQPQQMPMEESQEEHNPLSPDMGDDELLGYMEKRKTSKQLADEQAQMQAEEMQMEKMAQAEKEAQEIAMKQADFELRMQQGQAMLQMLQNIAMQLNDLGNKVGQPIQIIRDANGMIAGGVPVQTIN